MQDLLVAWDFNGVINSFGSDLEPVLRRLEAHGAEQIVVSSSTVGTIEQYLTEQVLDSYFSQIYGYSPTTLQWVGDSSTMKEDVLHHHSRKFGPYQRTVIIGDSETDIRAGKEVGAETILYSKGSLNFETQADHVVYKLEEIEPLILGSQAISKPPADVQPS